jgi:hypothetical protein
VPIVKQFTIQAWWAVLSKALVGLPLQKFRIEETKMKTVLSAVSLVLATVMSFGADASELMPLQAGTFVLGTHTISIYYTAAGDTYEVVTTIADTSGAPIRFVGFLEPGQKAFVSAGQFGTTAEPETLELMHRGNLLSATQLTEVATAK